MSAATAEETMVCAELWLSFGSLLRAYAAVASESAPLAAQVAVHDDTIRVRAGSALLDLRCDVETGVGSWQLTGANTIPLQGKLQLLHEGRIDIDGKTLDLDHAAIDFVALVSTAAANPAGGER